MLKRMNRNIDIKSRRVQQSVSKLDGFLRAEYNSEKIMCQGPLWHAPGCQEH